MDMRTVIVDPRRAFATEERFPDVDQLIQTWPAEAFAKVPLTATTAVVMLTHDPKIDEPALALALPSPAFYIGALGSKRTQAKRRERLKERGLTEAELDRLHGPVGLNLGADTPDEIALSIMAEIVASRHLVA
jgi:xanthine dehydrogenase accessory factor